jgi:phi13 family phage major tail protein
MAISVQPGKGVDNFVYTILTSASDVVGGTLAYGTVYPLTNLIKAEFDLASQIGTLYADNKGGFVEEVMGDAKINLTFADIMPEDYARLTGATYAGGLITQSGTDVSPYIAIGYRKLHSAGVYTYVWIYKVKLMKPAMNGTTATNSINFQTVDITGNVVALQLNGYHSIKIRSDDANVPSATITGWFTAPVFAAFDVTALTVTAAEGTVGDAGKIVATFAKGSGASFSMQTTSIASPNIVISTSDGLEAGAWSVGSAGTTVVCKFTPTSAFTGSQIVSIVVNNGARDNSGVGCTLYSDLITIA